jgi:hypothetical protein
MGWLGRGLGEFGSDVGRGYDINLDWRQRQQQMALENARQKIAQLRAPLELQELQQRIKQMGQTQPAGVEKLPGGGLGGVTFDPATGTYSIKTLTPGVPPEPKFPTLQAAAAYYLEKGDWEKLGQVNTEIEKTKTQPKPAEIKDPFELWKAQNPNAPVSEWLKMQEKFKKQPVDANAAYDRWVKEQEYKAAHPAEKPAKPIPPDVLNLLKAPVPKTPTAEQSRRLADAADRVFGGTAYKQDLIKRGARSPLLGLRSPYTDVAYASGEYAAILNSIKQAAGQQESSGEISPPNVPPPPGFVPNRP